MLPSQIGRRSGKDVPSCMPFLEHKIAKSVAPPDSVAGSSFLNHFHPFHAFHVSVARAGRLWWLHPRLKAVGT